MIIHDYDDDALVPTQSEEHLALRFAANLQTSLRYVAAWGRWYVWTDNVWKADETMIAFSQARAIVRKAAQGINKQKEARALASSKTVAAVERLAKSDRRLVATIAQWDADPWLLNTPDGVVDLRTGTMSEHRIEDYMTKVTAVSPGGAAPIWETFLDTVTGGDVELSAFLKRVAGYLLTGVTSEHALFFLYGTGANGKSVFIETIAGILLDYHRAAPISTFTASHSEQHPTELAMLVGSRAVTAVETEEGRRWAESRIKALTGGDRISARFMRQDFFEFIPQFKLVIAGNHKPGLRSVDEAMRRRINLIPFSVTIPKEKRDPELKEKLKAEWPGILQWMIDGCLDWQKNKGLDAPKIVAEATDEYMEAEDTLSTWIAECCIKQTDAIAPAGGLYLSWSQWATRNGEFAGSQKVFSQKLRDRGFEPVKYQEKRCFRGLKTNPDYASPM